MKKNIDAETRGGAARHSTGRWTFPKILVLGLFGALLICGVRGLTFAYSTAQLARGGGNPLFPPEMNAARDAKSPFVIGDLGKH